MELAVDPLPKETPDERLAVSVLARVLELTRPAGSSI